MSINGQNIAKCHLSDQTLLAWSAPFLTSSGLVRFFRLTAPAAVLGHLGAISLKNITKCKEVRKGADQATCTYLPTTAYDPIKIWHFRTAMNSTSKMIKNAPTHMWNFLSLKNSFNSKNQIILLGQLKMIIALFSGILEHNMPCYYQNFVCATFHILLALRVNKLVLVLPADFF